MPSIKIPKYPFPVPNNHNIIWNPLSGFVDLNIIGHYVVNDDLKMFKIILFEHFDSGYFRGQNKDYPRLTTSLQRLKMPWDICLAQIQKSEFIDWFLRSPYYQLFAYNFELAPNKDTPAGQGLKFCFDLEAISQHYEFATNYLDITTKKDIALFFAYTYKDKKSGEYKPVEDFSSFRPCLYEAPCNSPIYNPFNSDVRIIGFQPLRRPILQYAMGICMDNSAVDYTCEFIKRELPREKKNAYEIYDKFEGGKGLFPDDYASLAAEMIKNRVLNEKIINFEIFSNYCKKFDQSPKALETKLKNAGYTFSDDKLLMTEEATQIMQKDVKETLVPWIHEYVR